jgi:site-specific recombinase XerD
LRKIHFNHTKDGDVPIPYFKGGEVHTDLMSFLLCRYHHRTLLGSNLREATQTTIKNTGHHIAYLINMFEESELDYRTATFETVAKIIKELYEDYEWKGESLKVYASSWRLFYVFLTAENVNHNMIFPARNVVTRSTNKDDDVLSHTRRNTQEIETETAVPDKYCTVREDYRDSVISMKQWFTFHDLLYQDDPVYAVMAATMMQTFLRIGGIMQFPNGITKKNKYWKRYAQMNQADMRFQNLNYINKGQKEAKCLVHIATMKMLYDEYLSKLYSERDALYLGKYIGKKYAKKQKRNENSKFTWLNKNGTPVSIRELQQAFSKASKQMGLEYNPITPHTMRHTGATQLLYRWGIEKGIEITDANTNDIHSWLKMQLGHKSVETTKLYVTTVHRIQSENILDVFFSNGALSTSLDQVVIDPEARNSFLRAKEQQEVYMRGRAVD